MPIILQFEVHTMLHDISHCAVEEHFSALERVKSSRDKKYRLAVIPVPRPSLSGHPIDSRNGFSALTLV